MASLPFVVSTALLIVVFSANLQRRHSIPSSVSLIKMLERTQDSLLEPPLLTGLHLDKEPLKENLFWQAVLGGETRTVRFNNRNKLKGFETKGVVCFQMPVIFLVFFFFKNILL